VVPPWKPLSRLLRHAAKHNASHSADGATAAFTCVAPLRADCILLKELWQEGYEVASHGSSNIPASGSNMSHAACQAWLGAAASTQGAHAGHPPTNLLMLSCLPACPSCPQLQGLPDSLLLTEVEGSRKALAAACGLPESSIAGFRAPFLKKGEAGHQQGGIPIRQVCVWWRRRAGQGSGMEGRWLQLCRNANAGAACPAPMFASGAPPPLPLPLPLRCRAKP
jgi:hypothetical protein